MSTKFPNCSLMEMYIKQEYGRCVSLWSGSDKLPRATGALAETLRQVQKFVRLVSTGDTIFEGREYISEAREVGMGEKTLKSQENG